MAVGSSCETSDKMDSKVRGTHLANPMRMQERLPLSQETLNQEQVDRAA